tara:strand:- start:4011 stop:5030 length:1020 start_codon:yes stop_codon:yes gene_type:complete
MIRFVGKKNISHSRIRALLSISELTNSYTNNGPVKKLLEEKLEGTLGLRDKRVLCFSNGTTALHGIMFLCQRKYNTKKWVTPAFTFPSAVVGNMFDVDILDIDSNTATLPLDAKLLAPYDGIIITNLFGSYVDLKAWERFCHKYNKVLIFDNASSFLSKCDGINICNFGDYSFGSLHHTKYLGFGEGGFVIAPEEDYETLLQITNFGYDQAKKYNRLSSNYKMSDVSAAYILSQIENYDIDRHLDIQNKIIEKLSHNKKVEVFNYKEDTMYGNIPIIFDNEADKEVLSKQSGVEVFKYYRPLKEMPEARRLYLKMINLPVYSTLSDNDVIQIVEGLQKI